MCIKKYVYDHIFNQEETSLELVCPSLRSNAITGKKRAPKFKSFGCVKQH